MKRIVICCDGTGNEYGQNNTNVVETYALVEKNESQYAYYDPGVGTGGWEYNEVTGNLRAISDKATGVGLQRNVEDAYRYLMGCYESGDQIYLFGFSRGAFTVRSLAGMLYKCGLLTAGHENLIEYASKIYNTHGNDDIAKGFRDTFCQRCPIQFIGVWDTVESLALNAGKKWHDASLNPDVSYGYHALSIDEERCDFQPALWDETNTHKGQVIQQVWFAGVHSDVGGWYDERGLSNIALHWILEKSVACGLKINQSALSTRKPDPDGQMHQSFTGLWKIRGTCKRKIPEGALIHNSVFERIRIRRIRNSNEEYNPNNIPIKYAPIP